MERYVRWSSMAMAREAFTTKQKRTLIDAYFNHKLMTDYQVDSVFACISTNFLLMCYNELVEHSHGNTECNEVIDIVKSFDE